MRWGPPRTSRRGRTPSLRQRKLQVALVKTGSESHSVKSAKGGGGRQNRTTTRCNSVSVCKSSQSAVAHWKDQGSPARYSASVARPPRPTGHSVGLRAHKASPTRAGIDQRTTEATTAYPCRLCSTTGPSGQHQKESASARKPAVSVPRRCLRRRRAKRDVKGGRESQGKRGRTRSEAPGKGSERDLARLADHAVSNPQCGRQGSPSTIGSSVILSTESHRSGNQAALSTSSQGSWQLCGSKVYL